MSNTGRRGLRSERDAAIARAEAAEETLCRVHTALKIVAQSDVPDDVPDSEYHYLVGAKEQSRIVLEILEGSTRLPMMRLTHRKLEMFRQGLIEASRATSVTKVAEILVAAMGDEEGL